VHAEIHSIGSLQSAWRSAGVSRRQGVPRSRSDEIPTLCFRGRSVLASPFAARFVSCPLVRLYAAWRRDSLLRNGS